MKAQSREADERLLVEAAQHDPRRFAALYERNFERVYAYIARRVGDRDAAEDLTSEVFHQALANLGRYEWRGVPFAAWLYRIASNAIADRFERAARDVAGAQGDPAPDVPDDADCPSRSMREVPRSRNRIRQRCACNAPPSQSQTRRIRFGIGKSVSLLVDAQCRLDHRPRRGVTQCMHAHGVFPSSLRRRDDGKRIGAARQITLNRVLGRTE